MTLEQLKDTLGDHAKDIRLNLGNVLTTDGAPDLTQNQILGIALASAYSTKNQAVIEAVKPGVIDAIGKLPADAPRNRLGLAQWLASRLIWRTCTTPG